MSGHSEGAHVRAREGRGEAETIAIFDPPAHHAEPPTATYGHLYREPRPPHPPRNWKDLMYAAWAAAGWAATALLVLACAALAGFDWRLFNHLGGHG